MFARNADQMFLKWKNLNIKFRSKGTNRSRATSKKIKNLKKQIRIGLLINKKSVIYTKTIVK